MTPVETVCVDDLEKPPSLLDIVSDRGSVHIPFNQFSDVRSATRAIRNKGLYVAKWNHQFVFIKKTRAKNEIYHQLPERSWLAILNFFDLGPRLIGATLFEGEPAVVMEFFDGINEKEAKRTGFILTEEMKQEMRHAAQILSAHQIYPNDLQFMFTKSGHAVIVDAEWYYSPNFPPPQRQLPDPMPPLCTYNCQAERLVEGKIQNLSH